MEKNELYRELRKKVNLANRRLANLEEKFGADRWRS